ncbi:hypothetical protein HA135_00445 [Mycobacteroides chelonae]|nr:hypothetical protein [Mycobacteroides chelonae]
MRTQVSGRRPGRSSSISARKRPSTDRAQSAAIREWAGKNGHPVSLCGGIPAEVIDASNTAN